MADKDKVMTEELSGIHAVADALGVTPRTLRLYEDKGLIHPVRVGNNRAYSHRDIVRMRLILRGKRLGFSLREIQEFLDLYSSVSGQDEQMRTLAQRCRSRIDALNLQRLALEQTVAELEELEQTALANVCGAGRQG